MFLGIILGCKFIKLHFYKILFLSVQIWRDRFLFRHSVCWTNVKTYQLHIQCGIKCKKAVGSTCTERDQTWTTHGGSSQQLTSGQCAHSSRHTDRTTHVVCRGNVTPRRDDDDPRCVMNPIHRHSRAQCLHTDHTMGTLTRPHT